MESSAHDRVSQPPETRSCFVFLSLGEMWLPMERLYKERLDNIN